MYGPFRQHSQYFGCCSIFACHEEPQEEQNTHEQTAGGCDRDARYLTALPESVGLTTGSTIAPLKKPAIFLSERFISARQEEGRYETQLFVYVLVCKGLSNDDVGVPCLRRCGREQGFKTGDFVKENLGRRATVEPLSPGTACSSTVTVIEVHSLRVRNNYCTKP